MTVSLIVTVTRSDAQRVSVISQTPLAEVPTNSRPGSVDDAEADGASLATGCPGVPREKWSTAMNVPMSTANPSRNAISAPTCFFGGLNESMLRLFGFGGPNGALPGRRAAAWGWTAGWGANVE